MTLAEQVVELVEEYHCSVYTCTVAKVLVVTVALPRETATLDLLVVATMHRRILETVNASNEGHRPPSVVFV